MKLLIEYKNGTSDEFSENHLDCSRLTIKGHAQYLINYLTKESKGIYMIDNYNAILLDEIISVRVI